MRQLKARAAVLATAASVILIFLRTAPGQQVHHNGFESREPSWIKGAADATFRETAHRMTDLTAHSGQFSEYIELTADQGNFVHYFYPIRRAPINDELSISIWIKANRPGVQLLSRVVLPHERNPNNLDDRLTTLVRGDVYERVGRWQRLELHKPVALARQQQQLMRAELKRDVDFTDAYIDRIVLNLYGGPGKAEVWIDDLEAGPVVDDAPFTTTGRSTTGLEGGKPGTLHLPGRAAVVEFRGGLLISGKPFLFRGIRHSDTPLKALRDAGFNTVWFDYATPAALLEEAVNLGFWVVPSLPVTSSDPRLGSTEGLSDEVSRFLLGDAVLFWDLGGGLAKEDADRVIAAGQAVRAADPQRPLGVDAWDGFGPYSRTMELVGAHRWPLMTTLELPQYRQWLEQRLLLCRPGTFLWTWVQTHLPDWYTALVYNRPAAAGFDEPIGPQPEQIRLLTYTALAAGCRGIGFWSDRFLADSHQGRDRLLALALLNQELQLLEPMLVSAETPRWITTSVGEVQAAVMRTDRGLLVLPMWLGKGAQFVPGQSSVAKLTMTVPEVPAGAQAWEVSPAEVRALKTERVVGGTEVTVPEFGLTAAIIFTSDNNPAGLLVRFQDQVRRMQPLAAQWARNLAEIEVEKVGRVETQLEQAGHTLPDGQALMEDARKRLRSCIERWKNNDYREAYLEAERTLRPLRILMRAQWEMATRNLDSPVASPYAVSFYTLPRHWSFVDEMRSMVAGSNLLPEGNFEVGLEQTSTTWLVQETTLDDVVMQATRSTERPKEGKQCLKLQARPKNPLLPPPALERTFLALNSPAVHLPPGSSVRVSAWMRIGEPLAASVDGVLFYDSAGGEPLGVRLTSSDGWKKYTLYRRVPASGTISVTLALTALGTAYFDDIRIEPLVQGSTVLRPPLR